MATKVRFGSGSTIVDDRWSDFKAVVDAKGLLVQYAITPGNVYTIWASDGAVIYRTWLARDTLPTPQPDGYTQEQNDADRAVFEASYQGVANRRFGKGTVGSHGNAWSNAAVLANGVSAVLDTHGMRVVSAFGSANASTIMVLQFSMNNSTYYDGPTVILMSPTGGPFHFESHTAARYVRLKSTAAATITATLAAKE